ncbi:uncharacterized protein WCC33_013304 [Rhinophrynus dorsalis]
MEASLTCAVCLGLFREPVTLPLCSHNFCKSCVLECAAPDSRTVQVLPLSVGGASSLSTVSCPLCRKVSSFPGGVSSLPVNTTLAEVVRQLGSATATRDKEFPGGAVGRDCTSHESSSSRGSRSPCAEHSGQALELYCKNCAVPCCGKCVSDKHQGMFHSINLIDMVYQEEKLTLFSSLKKLREVHEKLTKETTDEQTDIEEAFRNEASDLTLAFEEVQKALALKKQQLVELVERQQNTTIKEYKVWKEMKTHHKKTVESLLTDCESIVDEFEPKSFLKVACDLNKRMKSSLDIMSLTSDHSEKKKLKWEPSHVDLKPALDAIAALSIAGNSNDLFTKGNEDGNFSFKSITRPWKHRRNTCFDKYSPVHGEDMLLISGRIQKVTVRYLAISEMPQYKAMSFEELRLKYYEETSILESKSDVFSVNEKPLTAVCRDFDKLQGRVNRMNKLKVCRLKRQDGFDENSLSVATKNDKTPQKDYTFAHTAESAISIKVKKTALPNCLEVGNMFTSSNKLNWISPATSCGSDTPSERNLSAAFFSTADIRDNPFQIRNESSMWNNQPPLPSFLPEKGEVTDMWNHNHHGKNCKKPKGTSLSSNAIAPICTVTENPFSVRVGNTSNLVSVSGTTAFDIPLEQPLNTAETNKGADDLSANSTSSEEFFDANSNTDSNAEEMNEDIYTESITPDDFVPELNSKKYIGFTCDLGHQSTALPF